MLRRDFLRAAAALAGYELLNGVYQPARKIFALGGVEGFNVFGPKPFSRVDASESQYVLQMWERHRARNGHNLVRVFRRVGNGPREFVREYYEEPWTVKWSVVGNPLSLG